MIFQFGFNNTVHQQPEDKNKAKTPNTDWGILMAIITAIIAASPKLLELYFAHKP